MTAIRMGTKGFDHRVEDAVWTTGPVQMARCEIARKALDGGYDYVLMHDDDLVVDHVGGSRGNPLDTFLALMQSDPKLGVVGAVYLRESPLVPTINMWHPDRQDTQDGPGEQVTAICNLPRAPFEVAGVGTGFMLIRAQVLRDIDEMTGGIDPFLFWPYQSQYGMPTVIGEDFYFCWRAQQAGWKVIADPTVSTVHEKDISGRLEFSQYKWDPADGKREHTVGGPEGSQLINVNGIDCLDVSPCRIREREIAAARKAA